MAFSMFDNLGKPNFVMVHQGKQRCVLYRSATQNLPLLGTVGLNPCMGLILAGTVTYQQDEINTSPVTKNFLLFDHNVGIDTTGLNPEKLQLIKTQSDKRTVMIDSFCSDVLCNMLTAIEKKAEGRNQQNIIMQIHLEKFYLIRCIQLISEKEPEEQFSATLQNETADQLKLFFSNQNQITQVATEADCSTITFSDHYGIMTCEENEVLGIRESSMDCYFKTDAQGELQVMCYHVKPQNLDRDISDHQGKRKLDSESQTEPPTKRHKGRR